MHQASSFDQSLTVTPHPSWMSSQSIDLGPCLNISTSSASGHLRTPVEGAECFGPLDSAYLDYPPLTSTRDGVYTPPPEMASSQFESLPHSTHIPYKPNSHTFTSPQIYFPGIPFSTTSYNLPIQADSATQRPQSPIPSPVWTTRAEEGTMASDGRSEGSKSTLIAASMQIPVSINNSHGSLAEFAAQVRTASIKILDMP